MRQKVADKNRRRLGAAVAQNKPRKERTRLRWAYDWRLARLGGRAGSPGPTAAGAGSSTAMEACVCLAGRPELERRRARAAAPTEGSEARGRRERRGPRAHTFLTLPRSAPIRDRVPPVCSARWHAQARGCPSPYARWPQAVPSRGDATRPNAIAHPVPGRGRAAAGRVHGAPAVAGRLPARPPVRAVILQHDGRAVRVTLWGLGT